MPRVAAPRRTHAAGAPRPRPVHRRRLAVATPPLARALLDSARCARDTFPGLPRPRDAVLIAIAPDARRFREWAGPGAPEWGAAIAFPASGGS